MAPTFPAGVHGRLRPGLVAVALLAVACAPRTETMGTASPGPFTYVAIGASDTVGVGSSDPSSKSWPSLLAARMPPGTAYVNVGVSGSTVAQALVEQLPRAQTREADVLTVWLAFNDLASGVSPNSYRSDLERLLDATLRAQPRARVFLANLPDLRGVPAISTVDQRGLADAVAAYNATIADVARTRVPRVVSVDLFTGSADVIAKELVVSADGLHPNDRGYERIAERFADAMRMVGVPLR